MPKKTEILKQKFIKSVGLPFQQLLPESKIIEILKAEKIEYRDRLFNPIVTLWAFLSQVLDSDKSCSNAVSRIVIWNPKNNQTVLLKRSESWRKK